MKTKTLLVASAAFLLAASTLLADVRNGLVAYWPMNTAPGSGSMTTPDVVAGNDLQGPLKDGGTALVAGRHGNAVTFTGASTDYLYLLPVGDTGLPVAKQGSWTYCVWVNGPSNQVSQSTYFAETTSGTSTQWRFAMESDGTTKTRTIIRDSGGSLKVNAVLGNTNTLDDTWHHLAYTYDISASKFICYVDGQPVSTNIFTYAQNAGSFNQISVGALVRATVAVPFTGAVDDLALWARPLSQGEIQDVMTNSIATPIPAFAPTVTVNPIGATNLFEGDSFTLSGLCTGTRPFSYQWMKDGTNYPGPDANSLTLSSMTTNDNGLYQLVFSNAGGSATSAVAQVTVNAFGDPNLTNGIIAYYPCDSIVAGKSPELVSAYDMPLFGGMTATNIVEGKWGNALALNKAIPQYGKKVFSPSDSMPGIHRTNCSISLWLKGLPPNGGIVQLASSLETLTALSFEGLTDPVFRMYLRTSTGTVLNDHPSSGVIVWDDTWHNVVYSQRDIGNGTLVAQVYIDGVLNTSLVPRPTTALKPDSLGFGINPRSTLGASSGGTLDEVVFWNRALSPDEVALIQTGYITNPPSALPALAIASFKADLAAVVSGDSTKLNWDVPGNITSATISGVGDVTAMTTAAGGTTNKSVTVNSNSTYTLTITRGLETASKTVTIGTVSGVAAGWSLLDNFDFYKPGVLTTNQTWGTAGGTDTALVVQPTNQNHLFGVYAFDGNGGGAHLPLNGLAFTAGQARTLFFRMTTKGSPASAIKHLIGLNERVGNFYYQFVSQGNAGPLVLPQWNLTDWQFGISDGNSGYVVDPTILATDAVYRVWIDVTNVPIVNVPGARVMPDEEDLFSVHIQMEGEPSRTTLFTDIASDRNLNDPDEFSTHYPDDNINKLTVMGNGFGGEVLIDDIYLSKTGILDTTPIGPGYAGPPPTLQIVKSGSQWQILFQGKLLETSSLGGTWSEVSGATSPYPVPTTGEKKFYRAVY